MTMHLVHARPVFTSARSSVMQIADGENLAACPPRYRPYLRDSTPSRGKQCIPGEFLDGVFADGADSPAVENGG